MSDLTDFRILTLFDFDLPYDKCTEAVQRIKTEEGKIIVVCEGFTYQGDKTCTICKDCKWRTGEVIDED